MGFAVGLSRLNSLELTRESRRERTITRQNSITPDPEDEDLPKVFPKKKFVKSFSQECRHQFFFVTFRSVPYALSKPMLKNGHT